MHIVASAFLGKLEPILSLSSFLGGNHNGSPVPPCLPFIVLILGMTMALNLMCLHFVDVLLLVSSFSLISVRVSFPGLIKKNHDVATSLRSSFLFFLCSGACLSINIFPPLTKTSVFSCRIFYFVKHIFDSPFYVHFLRR